MSGPGMETAKAEWVARVLGVRVGTGEAAATSSLAEAARAWEAASEAVDRQIGTLQAVLRSSDDDELQEIGEYGLNAITGGHKAKLMAALMGAERGNAGDLGKLAGLAAVFRQHLQSSDRVEACDENPFGVAVSIRGTLVPALLQLEASASA